MALQYNDLINTILPKISIDDFEPKSGLDEELIVVGFYAIDEEPAKDLDDFIEKGSYDIIDVDVSPNPNEDGHYLIFIELKRQSDFWVKLSDIIEDIENITGKQSWMITTSKLDYECYYNDPDLRAAIVIDPVEYAEQQATTITVPDTALESFFNESLLLTCNRKDAILEISDSFRKMKLEIVNFGPASALIDNGELQDLRLFESSIEIRSLRSMLGHEWGVNKVEENIIISNPLHDDILIVRHLE